MPERVTGPSDDAGSGVALIGFALGRLTPVNLDVIVVFASLQVMRH
jgi:hypothetical protein